MQLGLIGLGKMGGNMRDRLEAAGHDVVGYDTNPEVSDVKDLKELVEKLAAPRNVWVMVPAGEITQKVIASLAEVLEPGDTIIDGGNSYYRDDIAHAAMLAEKQLHLVDCGTSGGVWGLTRGFCLMIGGETEVVERLAPIWAVAADASTGFTPLFFLQIKYFITPKIELRLGEVLYMGSRKNYNPSALNYYSDRDNFYVRLTYYLL